MIVPNDIKIIILRLIGGIRTIAKPKNGCGTMSEKTGNKKPRQ